MIANGTFKVKRYLYHVSLTELEENGIEIGDDGAEVDRIHGEDTAKRLMSMLTKRQRNVAELLLAGYSRKATARTLGISLQAIHQIIPRMRRRLALKQRQQDL